MNRREFLGYSAGALALPALQPRPRVSRLEIIDLQEHCCLPESLAGYKAALAGLRARRSVIIVPALVGIPSIVLSRVLQGLSEGALVIIESGAAFGAERECKDQRDVLRAVLNLEIARPVELWPRRTPYVDYTWPAPATLRDFSRVVPIEGAAHEIVGWADGLAIASIRQVGRGALIFLGSPIGPALWAGDVDAVRWLSMVVG